MLPEGLAAGAGDGSPAPSTPLPPVRSVRLLSFPVQLFKAAEWHWQALLREYLLRGMEAHDQPYDIDQIGRAGAALDAIGVAAAPALELLGPGDRTDLTVALEVASATDFATLQGVLDDALRLARLERLLELPPVPEIVALRNWICEETTQQAVGAEPTPWELPSEAHDTLRDAAEWDRSIAPPEHVAWLVGDDQNRIVGASAAALALLGWPDGDLVGQRLLVVIPPALRERHVTRFAHSVLLGSGAPLGQPRQLPALTRSGEEVPITLTLTRHPARGGRTVYLATLGP